MHRTQLILVIAAALMAAGAKGLYHGHDDKVQSGPTPERQADVFPPPGSISNGGNATTRSATSRPVDSAALSEVHQAETSLAGVQKKLREKYEANPAYTAAANADKQAQSDYDAATAKVSTSLASDPAYAKAKADLKTAEDQLETARSDSSKRDELPTRAMAAMQARDTLRMIETQARSTDPAVLAAADKRAAAAAELAKVRAKFEGEMKHDPDYQAAEKTLADARTAMHH